MCMTASSSSTEMCLIQLKDCLPKEENISKMISARLYVQFNSSSETTTYICNHTTCNAISSGTTISQICPTTSNPQQMYTTTTITRYLRTTQPHSTNAQEDKSSTQPHSTNTQDKSSTQPHSTNAQEDKSSTQPHSMNTQDESSTQPRSMNTADKRSMTKIPMLIWVIIGPLLVLIIILIIILHVTVVMGCLVKAKKAILTMKNTSQPVTLSQLQTTTEPGNHQCCVCVCVCVSVCVCVCV